MQTYNLTILFSLFSLGFFGGFTHCSGMCGPFVLTQVSSRLQNISLDNFSTLKKLQNMALIPYHLGRITTYSFIGFLCSYITKNLKDLTNFNQLSGFFILIAAIIFLQNICEKKFIQLNLNSLKIKFPDFFRFLFKDPTKFKGYFLGIILGFIPCGLLYGAFVLAASIDNPFLAALGMFAFGSATFFALFATAFGGYFLLKFNSANFKLISKSILIINTATLFIISAQLIFK